jgi:hypothetical protein
MDCASIYFIFVYSHMPYGPTRGTNFSLCLQYRVLVCLKWNADKLHVLVAEQVISIVRAAIDS